MKVNVYKSKKQNSGELIKSDETINILKNRWIDSNGISHPLSFNRPIAFSNTNVYFLYLYGVQSNQGKHISLSFWENQKFLFIQNLHWLQKEENIRYVVNLIYLTIGLIFAYIKL